MKLDRKASRAELGRRWREQCALASWTCPHCHLEQIGVAERETGLLTGVCFRCGRTVVAFHWTSSGWKNDHDNDIVYAGD